ncbi:hypothetical protein ACFX14_029139 [Malus domestica]
MHNPNQRRFRFCSAAAGFPSFLPKEVKDIKDLFVQELFERKPLPFFWEGEYGVVDIFYAAAKSKNVEFFRLLFLLCGFAKWRSRNTLSATAMPHSPAVSQLPENNRETAFLESAKRKSNEEDKDTTLQNAHPLHRQTKKFILWVSAHSFTTRAMKDEQNNKSRKHGYPLLNQSWR